MRSAACIGVTACIVFFLWFGSPVRQNNIPVEAETITISPTIIKNTISLKGTAEEGDRREIYSEQAVKVEKIYVKVGQKVERGQALLELSPCQEETRDAEPNGIPSAVDMEMIEAYLPMLGISEENISALLNMDLEPEEISSQKTATAERTVTSPVSGTVMAVPGREGEIIGAGESCVAVSDLTNVQVAVSIPENYLTRISVGMEADITGEGFSGILYKGEVSSVAPYAQKASSLSSGGGASVRSTIRLLNADGRLLPGLTVSAAIHTETRRDTVAIPYEAVRQTERNQEYVCLVRDGRVVFQPVVTGFELAEKIEIVSGLVPGDVIIANPGETLAAGTKVMAPENALKP